MTHIMLNVNKKIVFAIIATAANCAVAMAQYSVSGTVVDTTGVGEPYATIRIYTSTDTAKAVTMGVTAEDGTFRQSLSAAGGYRLSIVSVGKQEIRRDFKVDRNNKEIDLGTMVARVARNVLGEVEVVAQKPLVTAEIDRLSYDVASDKDAKSNTILEMLKRQRRKKQHHTRNAEKGADGDCRRAGEHKGERQQRLQNIQKRTPRQHLVGQPLASAKVDSRQHGGKDRSNHRAGRKI